MSRSPVVIDVTGGKPNHSLEHHTVRLVQLSVMVSTATQSSETRDIPCNDNIYTGYLSGGGRHLYVRLAVLSSVTERSGFTAVERKP